jgi:hypothetical protein
MAVMAEPAQDRDGGGDMVTVMSGHGRQGQAHGQEKGGGKTRQEAETKR